MRCGCRSRTSRRDACSPSAPRTWTLWETFHEKAHFVKPTTWRLTHTHQIEGTKPPRTGWSCHATIHRRGFRPSAMVLPRPVRHQHSRPFPRSHPSHQPRPSCERPPQKANPVSLGASPSLPDSQRAPGSFSQARSASPPKEDATHRRSSHPQTRGSSWPFPLLLGCLIRGRHTVTSGLMFWLRRKRLSGS
jgi:hypothetical protein